MAVVTKYASGAQDPTVKPQDLLPNEEIGGELKLLVSTVEIANGNSATSVVHFGKVSSSARISIRSRIDHDGITGLTDFDLGDASNPDGLVNGADLHTAGNKSAVSAIDIANLAKPLWELLGYTADPLTDIDLIGTLNQAATANGTITLSLHRAEAN